MKKNIDDNNKIVQEPLKLGHRFSHMSIELVAGAALGGLIGYQIDKYLSTTPIAIIILTICGMIGGFWNFYKALMKQLKIENKPRNDTEKLEE